MTHLVRKTPSRLCYKWKWCQGNEVLIFLGKV